MPTYVYEILDESGEGTGRTFEHVQSMKAKPLRKHPETGEAVRRVPQAPAIAGERSPLKAKGKMSDKNLEKLGFTKYTREDKGGYKRRFGDFGEPTIPPPNE